jgi:hypothetical protein
MRGFDFGRRVAPSVGVLAFAAVSLPVSSQAARSPKPTPSAATTGTAASQKLKFVIPKPVSDVFGSPVIFSGRLSGIGEANHRIALQASLYPFLEPFARIGAPGTTDGLGRFSFRIANLTTNTQLRVVTLDVPPIDSPVVILDVAVRVSFSMHSSGRAGFVRLYGTVTPAVNGAQVYFQVLQRVKPGTNGESRRYVSQFLTPVKPASQKFSRFSTLVRVRRAGRYRALVKVLPGPVVSGVSAGTIVLHAAPGGEKK